MSETQYVWYEAAGLSGRVEAGWLTAGGERLLSDFEAQLAAGTVLHAGRHVTTCVLPEGMAGGDGCGVVVKAFGRQAIWKDCVDRRRGSKARRSWEAAVHLVGHGVGTPEPLAYLERWEGCRLACSYYVSRYEAGTVSFADELGRLFAQEPEAARFMALFEVVAAFVAAMHRSGFVHQDLGNQNLLMRRSGNGWGDVMVIDLNRGRCVPDGLGVVDRARDLSRLSLPSDFLRVFIEMYAGAVPEPELLAWEARFRRRFGRHTASRQWRHPVRSWRQRHAPPVHSYPDDREMWVWDERSGQALTVHASNARTRLYPLSRHLGVLPVLGAGVAAWRTYRRLLPDAFAQPVALDGRLGVALEASPEDEPDLLARFDALGAPCAQVRFYRHKGPEQWQRAGALVHRLADRGVHVGVCLLQDRAAVRDCDRLWEPFCREVLKRVRGAVAEVEVAHAINRVKWGIWAWCEYRRLLEVVWQVADEEWPEAPLTGPAAIDFEYHYVLAALRQVPRGRRFTALSHHLYVDRRGAPERMQGRFSVVGKAALALAIAQRSRGCEGKLVVSEVNWPLAGTGVYSPVGAPYESPGERHHDPSVTEWDYACYLVRYVLLCLCSGFVSRIYWWQLLAHGYGLIDGVPAVWRERPAYGAFGRLCERFRGATFLRAERRGDTAGDGIWLLHFEGPEGAFRIGWSDAAQAECLPVGVDDTATGLVSGRKREAGADALRYGAEPMLICHC